MTLRVLYGGTFDPVHNGHLAVARNARDALAADIHLLPAADPPHKGPTHADAGQRAAMLALAVDDTPGLWVDPRELHRAGPSYTVDTLHQLRAEAGTASPLAILVGADSFLGLPTWKAWRTLFDLAHIVVAERPGSHLDEALPDALAEAIAGRWTGVPAALHAAAAGRVFRLRQPHRPESASELRRRIAAGEPWQAWVPAPVAAYIAAQGLYRP